MSHPIQRTINSLLLLAGLCISLLAASSQATADDQPPTLATHDRWVTSVAFSPDGKTLATAGGQSLLYRPGDVMLWDAASGKHIASLKGHETNVWSVAISSDGLTLATSGYDGKVIVWDIAKREAKHTLEKHKGWVRRVAISPDGKLLASAGEDGTVILWNIETGEPAREIKAQESAVYGVAFSPDGATLATSGLDKLAKLWSVADGAEKAKLEGHGEAVWAVAFSPNGSRIATAGADRTVRIWDAAGGPQATLVGHKNWVGTLAFSPDGKQLATGSHDQTVRVWNLETAIKLAEMAAAAATKLQETSRAHADAQLAAESAARPAADNQAKIEGLQKQIAEEQDEKKKEELNKQLAEAEQVMPALIKARNETAAKAKETGDAAVAAADENAQLQAQMAIVFPQHNSTVWSVAFSPDGSRLAAGSHRQGVRVFDVAEKTEVFPPSEAK